MSLTLGEKLSSYSTVKNWFAVIKTGQFSSEDEDCATRPLVVTLLQIWMPFTSWSWQIGEIQPKRQLRLWRYLGTVLGSSSMMCWTRESSLPNGCHNEWMRIRSVIVLWLHKKSLSTVNGPQQVSWLDLWQWMKHGRICVIDRRKNNLRSGGDTVAHLIQKSFEYKSQPPRQRHLFSKTKWDTARRLPQKGCNNDSKLIHISLGQSEAGNGLKRRGKLSKRVSFLQDNASSHTPVHYTTEVGWYELWSA